METSEVEKEVEPKIVHHVDRVNLYEFAYEKAGSAKGDPDLYVSYLNRMLNGDLVENNYSGFTDEEKKERIKQIKELEAQLKEREELNSKVGDEIKAKEKEIDKYRKDLLQIREKRSKDPEVLKNESFSVLKFSINLFLLSMLSVYLFFFYVSAAFKALYVDFEGIAERIAKGEGTGSIMPGAYELAEALQYNYLLFVVPFVFYAFGWAFHVILQIKDRMKFVFLSLLIAVTFTVDFLLAMIISNNTENARSLMGLPAISWSQSPTFYIILFLGFMVYIIWSILLDSLLREWDKKEITNNLKKIIKHLNNDIKILKPRIFDVSYIKTKIQDYREDASTVMHGNLKKYIDQFTSGWIAYLAPVNLKEVKEKCLVLKKEFEDRNNIKSGIVKVTSKRPFLNFF
ncbi:hypothetical protein WSM22_36690 [Cytophagales bacterium WSM2-2]|nr:hypothetical protein WSM22_36690 [Cytophagales bacterium WSM2-2]